MKKDNNIVLKLSVLMVFILIIFSAFKTNEVDFERVSQRVENTILMNPMPANDIYNDYVIYIPGGYKKTPKEASLLLEFEKAIYSIYFGLDTKVDRLFLEGINQGKEKLIDVVKEDDNDIRYFYMWNHETNQIDDYVSVILGKNDIFLEGIFPKKDIEKYSVEMAEIFNSIKKIKKGE